MNMAKKNNKETSFDLLQTDSYEITGSKEDTNDELDFESFELNNTSLEELESSTDESEELTPVEHKEVNLEENDNPKDINSMFEKATSSVLEAKNIFAKNVEMKEQIDLKFKELEQAKDELEKTKKADIAKINSYKDSVTTKLREKKNELDEQVNKLKEARQKYEQDKTRFETYKKEEFERVKQLKKEQNQEMEERKKELDSLTDSLKQQRDEIEEERRQLEIDKIKYESDKNELANNLLKFNELVSDFTVNMDKFNN
jgi:chromosome segregation ATPase